MATVGSDPMPIPIRSDHRFAAFARPGLDPAPPQSPSIRPLECEGLELRVGGFDFVGGSEHTVHLIKSKVDLWKKSGTTVFITEESSIGKTDIKK